MRISDWSSDVCSSDLKDVGPRQKADDEIGGGDLKSLTEQFYPRADRLERSKQGHLFGFHAQRHDANGWMMRIIRRGITILKSEQGHSPALCREMIAQKADNTLRPAGPKALEDKADMGFCHADRSRILAQSRSEEHTSELPSLLRTSYA